MTEENKVDHCGCSCDHEHGDDCCGGACGCGAGEHCDCQHGGDASEEEFDYSQFDVDLPKPTLTMIVTTIAQQAMVSMGILPNPATGKSVFLMKQAAYLIDSIDVLFEKTQGNRTDDETRTISNVMSELRMLYVKASEEKSRRDAAKNS